MTITVPTSEGKPPTVASRVNAACPHCGAPAKIRSSRALSPTFRQLNISCTNFMCGATYGAAFEITHEISPPTIPNPRIQLRKEPPRRRPANDDTPVHPSGPEVPLPADDTVQLTG